MGSIGTVGGWRSTHKYRRYVWRKEKASQTCGKGAAVLTRKGAVVLGCEFVKVVDDGTGTVNNLN